MRAVNAVANVSRRAIPLRERLIFALDVPDIAAAQALVMRLGDAVHFYKIGLELAAAPGYFDLLAWLVERDKKVFADWKLYDIPATVGRAVRQLRRSGATFLTVHGDRSITAAAAAEKGPDLTLLAVTVLTSMSETDLRDMGFERPLDERVEARARIAVASGCDGVIASGLEAARLRAALGPDALVVTPGIRPAGGAGSDDQRRIVTPAQAFRAGADHIVVGRPIRDAEDPQAAAATIQDEIAAVFE
jgi:orotidine-5'-phosphate decarboxylase